ncbi:Hypothetical predicted protein, partial [Drosophila guanche]
MFLKPKSFEQTLRGGIVPAVPAAPGSGLNPSFHKGCTGKAHACGTNKSGIQKVPTPSKTSKATSKAQRKNSISSETISESGSENSNSWPSSSTGGAVPPPKPPRLAATKAKEAAAAVAPATSPLPITPIFERATNRSRSFRSKAEASPPTASIRPPWNSSAVAASKYAAAAASAPQSPVPSLRSSYRRRRDAQNIGLQWPAIWATALAGNYKNYDASVKRQK